MVYQPLPVGVDNFEKLINKGYYYVDKTLMIKDLLDRKGELQLEGYEDVTAYGICFFRKECLVMAEEEFPGMQGL